TIPEEISVFFHEQKIFECSLMRELNRCNALPVSPIREGPSETVTASLASLPSLPPKVTFEGMTIVDYCF
ncbi:hypothetical protein ACVDHD_23830, partial [Enterobacter roggenkampii]